MDMLLLPLGSSTMRNDATYSYLALKDRKLAHPTDSLNLLVAQNLADVERK
jgi:hypothetical protein